MNKIIVLDEYDVLYEVLIEGQELNKEVLQELMSMGANVIDIPANIDLKSEITHVSAA